MAEGIDGFTATSLASNQGPVHLARKVAPLVQVTFDGTEVGLMIPIPAGVDRAQTAQHIGRRPA